MIAFLRSMTGLIGWAIAFSLIYGLQGLVCSPRLASLVGNLPLEGREVLIAAWLLSIAVLAWATWVLYHRNRRDTLLDWLAPVLAITGLAATAYTGFPVVFATTCA